MKKLFDVLVWVPAVVASVGFIIFLLFGVSW